MKAVPASLALPLPATEAGTPFPAAKDATSPAAPLPPSRTTRAAQAWVAIRFPDWPLHSALQKLLPEAQRQFQKKAVAVLQDDRRRSVLCANARAMQSGIRPGHSLNAAIALCGDLHCLLRDPQSEAALLQAMAIECQRFTPTVAIEPDSELLLEVRASLRLFGGARALLQLIASMLNDRNLNHTMALSPTARSAQWICRSTASNRVVPPRNLSAALFELPLQVLHWPLEIYLRLQRFGVTKLGDLMRLPRAGLARRIGRERLAELDQALGRRPDLRCTIEPAERYAERVLLDFEIETTHLAETLLNARLDGMQQFLIQRTLCIADVLITLKHREHPETQVRIGLASPTADMAHVKKLLHETFHAVRIPEPIREIAIAVDRLVPAQPTSHSLSLRHASLATSSDTQARTRLLEQLHARFGREAVKSIGSVADRRPEFAHMQSPVQITAASKAIPCLPSLPQRPLWLLRQPLAIKKADGSAQHLDLGRGPERIRSGWWDGTNLDRDYFLLQRQDGSLAWCYQDRARSGQWFLHGLYA